MPIREATEADLPALMPLLRGYCDFYESNPTDAGLEALRQAMSALDAEREAVAAAAAELRRHLVTADEA